MVLDKVSEKKTRNTCIISIFLVPNFKKTEKCSNDFPHSNHLQQTWMVGRLKSKDVYPIHDSFLCLLKPFWTAKFYFIATNLQPSNFLVFIMISRISWKLEEAYYCTVIIFKVKWWICMTLEGPWKESFNLKAI